MYFVCCTYACGVCVRVCMCVRICVYVCTYVCVCVSELSFIFVSFFFFASSVRAECVYIERVCVCI
jgi:hypothetical protein